MLENPMCMIRVFERSGISLKTDKSEDKICISEARKSGFVRVSKYEQQVNSRKV